MDGLHSPTRAIRGLPNPWQKWLRPLFVGMVIGACLLGTASSVGARRTHTVRLIAHYTSFVTTQKDPTAFAPGEELFLGAVALEFDNPHHQLGTVGIWCGATGSGGSELLCHGGLILADGKVMFQMLIVQPDEPVRYAAITGGTGAYRGAGGQATGKTLANGDEVMTFYFDD